MNNDNKKFKYTYAAPTEQERREIDSIRRQYAADGSVDKLEQLRRLDGKVKNPPKILGIILGIAGILVFGLGLTMVLEWSMAVWGTVVSAVGVVPMALAYPAHQLLLKHNKNKYGQVIVELSDELLNAGSDKQA